MRFDSVVPNINGFIEHSTRQGNDPCVVDENVDAAEGAFYLGHGRRQCCPIRHIEPRDHCRSTNVFEFRKHKLILFLVTCENSHGCARAGQAKRHGTADSAVTAGHNGYTATQVKKGCIASHLAPE